MLEVIYLRDYQKQIINDVSKSSNTNAFEGFVIFLKNIIQRYIIGMKIALYMNILNRRYKK